MTRVVINPAWFEESMLRGGTEYLDEVIGAGIERDAISLAPVKSGELKASIGREMRSSTTVRIGTGVGGHPSCDHGAVTELGSRPHEITVKTKKVLANVETGEIFGKKVQHPGTQPQPYLSPALMRRRG